MRKVKFTQDTFDEKLGAILNDFPILDVCTYLLTKGIFLNTKMILESPSLPFIPPQCALRQESL